VDSEELNLQIEELCKSKTEEFALFGYKRITGEDIWKCVSAKYKEDDLPPLHQIVNAKYKEDDLPPLHQIVNDILSLKVTSYMNWMTMNALKTADILNFRR